MMMVIMMIIMMQVFATGVVTCVGMVMGVVVARDHATARAAADLVRIEYEELPPIYTIEVRHTRIGPSRCATQLQGVATSGVHSPFMGTPHV
jgi:xanthine dehydrogenase molybdopterin-binding subunit B